ncbi:hypothetical protein V500_01061 [Pseudogymnoascus sp. VKM F-4518 (FW-2643)]|nr:hypothetical protein V500_01061 [Pseudogymnoascus sp. VKM F-4518 (FW-2643)]
MRLEIAASDHDVQRYLDGHMLQLPGFVLRNLELQGEIKAEIVKAVNGMFLLAQLHFDSLKGKTSRKAIRTALEKLPTGSEAYDKAYNDAMERIEGQLDGQKRLAKQVLSWITCAKRPLTTSELEHALAVELGESQFDEENLSLVEDMVSVCAGLVTVDEESAIIRLVHYTAQEYFERTQKVWFPDAETDIAEICITYLSFNDFETGICQNDEELDKRLQSNPLYDYASSNWGHHARKGFTLIPEVISFLETKGQVEASIQALFAQESRSGDIQQVSGYSQTRPMTGLHLAAYFGLKDAVNSYLETGLSAQLKDSSGRTPLSWAAEKGHEAAAELLLDKGAKVDAKDKFGHTPLSWAAQNGHEAVAELLLDKGAKVDAKDKSGQTPLSLAAVKWHEAVAELLLDKGAEVDAKDRFGLTLLSMAAMNGQEAFAELLLNKGAKVDAKDKSGHTPLSRAAGNGQEAVVELLLDKGAKVDAKDKSGQTPLSWAARNGHEAVAELLLDKDAKVDAKDKSGQTPLSLAAVKGHEAVAELLLDKGAEVDPKDGSGRTPLFLAAENGHEMVEQLLRRRGALVVEDLYGLVALFTL